MAKKVRWTAADNNRALKEGWGIYNDNAIQRDDEPPQGERFPSDDDALSFVITKAQEGSKFHQRALDYLKLAWRKKA